MPVPPPRPSAHPRWAGRGSLSGERFRALAGPRAGLPGTSRAAVGSPGRRIGPAHPAPVRPGRAARLVALVALAGTVLTACSALYDPADGPTGGTADGRSAAVPASPAPTATATPEVTVGEGEAGRPAARTRPGTALADRAAGVLSGRVPDSGDGRLVTVPGDVRAPGRGRVLRVRVQVEGGLPVAPAAFADFVLGTLNDDRGWGHGGTLRFARTDGAADIRVVLASPELSAAMCRPLRTGGTLSCRNGDAVVLTWYRWAKGSADYGRDRTGYRRYVVSHEVGHALGRGHVDCPGRGRLAPTMMQQTKGLRGCRPNPWPNP